jgi:hypothetical protein
MLLLLCASTNNARAGTVDSACSAVNAKTLAV